MKKSKKLVSILLAVSALASVSFAGCDAGRGGNEEFIKVDKDKTQLYVFSYDGGVGREYMRSLISRFEEAYKDVPFEDGKTGVQVVPTYEKQAQLWTGDGLIGRMPTLQEEVIFTESVYYYDLINAGVVKDISDWVTTPLTEYNETESIADKIKGTQKEFFKTSDNKYYALPYWEGYMGMYYDVDLFTQKNLYISADSPVDGQGTTKFVSSKTAPKSKGPNGKSGDSDDGLPATYNEFFNLLNRMKTVAGIVEPISFPGVAPEYVYTLGGALANDYAGYDAASVNYTFNGEIEVIDGEIPETVKYDKSVATKTVTVTPETGNLVAKQSSKYYALDFMRTLMRGVDTYYNKNCLSDTFYHTENQGNFLKSKYSDKQVGILIDGSWWESEAASLFDLLKDKPNSSRLERNFAMMPMPRPYVTEGEYEATLTTVYTPLCMVNNNISASKEKVVEAFVRFAHTDESLSNFTEITSIPLGYDYEIQDVDKMSAYGKSVWDIRKNANIIYPFNSSKVYLYDGASHTLPSSLLGKNGAASVYPTTVFRKDKGGYTVAKMMKTIIEKYDGLWSSYPSNLF